MEVEQLKQHCKSLHGVVEENYAHPSNVLTYKVGRRKFAYFKTSEPEQWRFSIRVSPDRFLEMTDQAGIKPARYMHRFHWITIVDVGSMPSDYLTDLIAWSYDKATAGLSKKCQAALGV